MDAKEFELFEQLPDRSLNWRGLVRGLESARVTLWLLADEIGHDCFAMNCGNRQVVLARAPLLRAKRLFHVGYDDRIASNAHFLRSQGYDVTSVRGNRVAQFVLCMHAPYELFVIDHSEPEQERLEMMNWIRAMYPNTRLLVLQQPLAEGLEQRPGGASEKRYASQLRPR